MIQPIADWLTLDENGMRMPWYTRPCLEWLNELDLYGLQIFEYGCGGSTWWYRSRGAKVDGVDSSEKWSQMSRARWTDDKTKYIECILYFNHQMPFDIIIVDGDYRDDCAAEALNFLKPGGYLIIDNYMQPSVEPNTWDKFHAALDNVIGYKKTVYKEPDHEDWKTLVIQMP
jgi:SAM-dependent methyltransferase